ncbi:MAG: flagellar hook capping FlgD N-terminal domain-containing protein [Planctomycetota bacterium]
MQTGTVGATRSAEVAGAGRDLNALRSEDFFKLLVTELQQQDPFEPAKTADMIGQVSQIRTIELSKQLTDTLSELSRQQRTAGASDLLGKFVVASVTASDGTVSEVQGIVTGVRFDPDGTAVLELDTGQAVRAADVTRITSAQETGTKEKAKGKALNAK